MILHRILYIYDEWRYSKAVGLFDKAEKRLERADGRVRNRIQRTEAALRALTLHSRLLDHRSTKVNILRGNLKKIASEPL